jgi:hypothetical protein
LTFWYSCKYVTIRLPFSGIILWRQIPHVSG